MNRLNPQNDFKLSPKSGSNIARVIYAAGSAYQLTATPALAALGTTSPSVTLDGAGTYLLLSRAKINYTGATFAAVRTVSLKLRRTNNTAADISNAVSSLLTQIITLLTFTAGTVVLPPVVYTTDKTDDVVQLFGSVDVLPTAGTIDVAEAEIIAIKLS